MEIQEKNIALFEAYLSNSMDEHSALDFEAKLIFDSDFKNQFETFKSIESGIKEHYANELKQKFSELDIELDKNLSVKPKNNKVIWLSTAVAASIILGVFIYQHFSNKISLSQLAQENWIQDEGLPVQMSNKGKYDDAMNAFKLQNWDLALIELNKIKSDTSNYYAGLVYFDKKEYQKSIADFEKIENNSIYFEQARFRIALLNLVRGNPKKGKLLLENCLKLKDPQIREFAKSVLSKM
jgi:tetratricopeptide (TPR) repeat protein